MPVPSYTRNLKRHRLSVLLTEDMRSALNRIAVDEDYDSVSDLVRSLIKEKLALALTKENKAVS